MEHITSYEVANYPQGIKEYRKVFILCSLDFELVNMLHRSAEYFKAHCTALYLSKWYTILHPRGILSEVVYRLSEIIIDHARCLSFLEPQLMPHREHCLIYKDQL
jgi:hypothetical protein